MISKCLHERMVGDCISEAHNADHLATSAPSSSAAEIQDIPHPPSNLSKAGRHSSREPFLRPDGQSRSGRRISTY
jgi:hypothetical protein